MRRQWSNTIEAQNRTRCITDKDGINFYTITIIEIFLPDFHKNPVIKGGPSDLGTKILQKH